MRRLGLGLALVIALPSLGIAQTQRVGSGALSSASIAEHAAVARSKAEAAREQLKRISPPAIPSSALSTATPLRADQVEALIKARTSGATK